MAYKKPKDGYVINDPQHGSIFIGSDKKVKGVERGRQIAVQSASGAALKLFDDGGFEIQSQSSSKIADNIASRSEHGLHIKGRNIHLDATNGTLTISARSIVIQSGGSDQNCVIRSEGNLSFHAADTLKLDGSVVAIGSRTRMLLGSSGSMFFKANGGITMVEPKQKLIPTSVNDFLNLALSQIFPNYF